MLFALISVILFAIAIVGLCAYGKKRSQLTPLKISPGDELYRFPYGAKFTPNVLNCGSMVVYDKVTYDVSNVMVMVINDERWLFYKLRSHDDGRIAALSVATGDNILRLCWWRGGERQRSSAIDDLEERSAILKKFGDGHYDQVARGGKCFISLGSTEYPPRSMYDYELLERVPLRFGRERIPRWLLSLAWKSRGEVFIGERIGEEEVVIRPPAEQKPGIEPEEFSKTIERLEKVSLGFKWLAFFATLMLLYYLGLIPEWLVEALLESDD